MEDPATALRELHRVTRPGGTLVICEFSTPTWAPFRIAYLNYLVAALPRIARLISSNPVAYEYLAESIRAWPDQPGLAAVIGEAGWRSVEWRNLSGASRLHGTGVAVALRSSKGDDPLGTPQRRNPIDATRRGAVSQTHNKFDPTVHIEPVESPDRRRAVRGERVRAWAGAAIPPMPWRVVERR